MKPPFGANFAEYRDAWLFKRSGDMHQTAIGAEKERTPPDDIGGLSEVRQTDSRVDPFRRDVPRDTFRGFNGMFAAPDDHKFRLRMRFRPTGVDRPDQRGPIPDPSSP